MIAREIVPRVSAEGLQAGQRIECIVIESVLGWGGHGPMYLARDTDFGIVAAKEYAPGVNGGAVDGEADAGEDATSQDAASREPPAAGALDYDAEFAAGLTLFRLMGQALCAVQHPNLVPVRRCIEARGTAYVVMDYIESPSLDQVLAEGSGPRSEDGLGALLLALLGALDRLHGAGFIHRDVKPANIRFRPKGVPVLVDFGAALPADLVAQPPYRSRLAPGYAAPEQYRTNGREGPWTDIYALAAVAYQIVSGTPPPDARARASGGSRLVSAAEAGRGRYPEPVLASIDRALSLEAAGRPQSAQEWIAALGPSQASRAGNATTAPLPEPAGANEAAAADQPPDQPPDQPKAPDNAEARAARRPRRGGPQRLWARRLWPQRLWPQRLWRRRGWPRMAAAALVLIALPGAIIGGRTYYLGHIKSEWIVDVSGNGDVKSIAEAMATARTGATIRVRPGRYAEALVMTRPLILRGAGEVAEIVVVAPEAAPCITITAASGTISGISLSGGAGGTGGPRTPPGACVEIGGASTVTISETIIRNAAGAGVRIGGSAAPDVRANYIENTWGPAVIVTGHATASIVANAIVGSGAVGVLVRDWAAPLLMGNRIDTTAQAGILVSGDSTARIVDNRILNSAWSGIEVRGGAAPAVEGNHVDGAGQAGIYVYEGASGTYRGNTVVGSAFSGVVVGPGAGPTMSGNRIAANKEHGVLVLTDGGGRYQGNTIADNGGYGIAIDVGASLQPDDVEGAGNILSGNLDPQIVTGATPAPEPHSKPHSKPQPQPQLQLQPQPQSQFDRPASDQQRQAPTPPPDDQ